MCAGDKGSGGRGNRPRGRCEVKATQAAGRVGQANQDGRRPQCVAGNERHAILHLPEGNVFDQRQGGTDRCAFGYGLH